jgi:hypothetical protein
VRGRGTEGEVRSRKGWKEEGHEKPVIQLQPKYVLMLLQLPVAHVRAHRVRIFKACYHFPYHLHDSSPTPRKAKEGVASGGVFGACYLGGGKILSRLRPVRTCLCNPRRSLDLGIASPLIHLISRS